MYSISHTHTASYPTPEIHQHSVVHVSGFPFPICQLKMLAFAVVDNFQVTQLAQFWLLINLLKEEQNDKKNIS